MALALILVIYNKNIFFWQWIVEIAALFLSFISINGEKLVQKKPPSKVYGILFILTQGHYVWNNLLLQTSIIDGKTLINFWKINGNLWFKQLSRGPIGFFQNYMVLLQIIIFYYCLWKFYKIHHETSIDFL